MKRKYNCDCPPPFQPSRNSRNIIRIKYYVEYVVHWNVEPNRANNKNNSFRKCREQESLLTSNNLMYAQLVFIFQCDICQFIFYSLLFPFAISFTRFSLSLSFFWMIRNFLSLFLSLFLGLSLAHVLLSYWLLFYLLCIIQINSSCTMYPRAILVT